MKWDISKVSIKLPGNFTLEKDKELTLLCIKHGVANPDIEWEAMGFTTDEDCHRLVQWLKYKKPESIFAILGRKGAKPVVMLLEDYDRLYQRIFEAVSV